MRNARLVAGRNIAKALADVRETLRRVPEPVWEPPATKAKAAPAAAPRQAAPRPPAPTPSVKAPQQVVLQVEAAPPPTVTVEGAEITVLPPVPRAYTARITERDQDGFILAFRIEPA